MSLMNVQPRQLHAFLEVCRLQSFSKAAEKIPMSQSGISMLIRDLETTIGARLFDRTTRLVVPTDAGRKLQVAAKQILLDYADLEESLAGTRVERTSRLSLAATPMVSANLLPATLNDFRSSHPGVKVELEDVEMTGVRQAVLEGHVDIGLGFFIRPAVGLGRTPICKFKLMLISPVQSFGSSVSGRAGLGQSRNWNSLSGLDLISLPPDNPIQYLIETHLKRINRANERRPTMNFIGTLVGMVEAGLGNAIIPSFALPECLRRQVMVSMLVEPSVSIDLIGATRRGVEPKAIASEFTQVLRSTAARMVAKPASP
ncbi:LysR family transcriptional regulator [Paraburkholderia sp. Cy-641]|uniref:LysR family transcriptional regulator n=1 Tax=Paraburkholderia sp. Cy-641 TaxID=2608337 RepID=UPI001F040BB6|nr:LysR family transcriptional regulator [Paraburkholderia sp. Cy-641]